MLLQMQRDNSPVTHIYILPTRFSYLILEEKKRGEEKERIRKEERRPHTPMSTNEETISLLFCLELRTHFGLGDISQACEHKVTISVKMIQISNTPTDTHTHSLENIAKIHFQSFLTR